MICLLLLLALAGLPVQETAYVEDGILSTGRADPHLTKVDHAMRAFMRKQEAPGATLAISKDGRLVYARGFGYSNTEEQEPMQPDSLMRIASLSKPITSAMLFLLVQDGSLTLDDPILEHLPHQVHSGQLPADSRWADITLRQLLRHEAGFDRELSGDPMFQPRERGHNFDFQESPGPRDIIGTVLRAPLDFDPGSRFAYSNFGYCLLGRVIEQVTEAPYESAVRKRLLLPLGITNMWVGHSLPEERLQGEVTYYSPNAGARWSQETLDSHGGWVASAPSLLRFTRIYDLHGESPLLTQDTIDLSFARSPSREAQEPVWYGCGWEVRDLGSGNVNTWHRGTLPGTAALMVRRADGIHWALLFNALKGKTGEHLTFGIEGELNRLCSEIVSWPEFDLFDQFPRR